jgi:hypothetical protein
MNVPTITLQQLGGNRFLAMTGAKCSGQDNTLICKLPRRRIVSIELAPSDTYTVRYGRLATMAQVFEGKPAVEWLDEADDVYCDALRAVFTRMTGLETSL